MSVKMNKWFQKYRSINVPVREQPKVIKPVIKIFELHYSKPSSDGISRRNGTAYVSTTSAERSILLLKNKHPTAEVWQCFNRAAGEVIIDSGDLSLANPIEQ